VDVLDVIVEHPWAAHRGRVGVHVDEEIDPERDDSRQLVQLPQKKGTAEFNRHLTCKEKSLLEFFGFLKILELKTQLGNCLSDDSL
jgi:hypothetical protein